MNQLPPDVFQRKYSRRCRLGEGAYGSVYLCRQKSSLTTNLFERIFQAGRNASSQYVAVKIYKRPNNRTEGIDFSCLREISCLQMFQHPNLVNCLEVLYSQHKESNLPFPYQIAAVMDFCLELKPVMAKYKNMQGRKRIAKQILMGLDYLHTNFYFHRDLKLQNVFVSREGWVKLADFGFTKQYGTPYKKYTTNACTIEYRAPELFFGTHYYTQKSDIWSAGCILAYLFTDKPLFDLGANSNPADIEILSQIFYLFGTLNSTLWPGCQKFPVRYRFKEQQPKDLRQQLEVSQQVADILNFVMKMHPPQRPSARQILEHDFFKEVSKEPLDVSQLYEERIAKLIGEEK